MAELRDYQREGVEDALRVLRSGGRRLYASPTGSGKSYVEVAVMSELPSAYIVTPRVEIGMQLVDKGADASRVLTPIAMRNRLERGELSSEYLIFDEGHHDGCASWRDIRMLAGDPPSIALTATPYRGTPQGTQELIETWGEPHWLITFRQAVERGVITMPSCVTHPLVDDDEFTVRAGEFVIREVDAAVRSSLDHAVHLVDLSVPTAVTCPTVALAYEFAERCPWRCRVVTSETSLADRLFAFRSCVECYDVLVQVQVVGEGVDLPIRRLLDLTPSVSPVAWLQRFGRITRPGGESTYICTNRNLMRHGYLLDGCLPFSAVRDAQSAFTPTRRDAVRRAFGLETLGKLKPCSVPLMSGLSATAFCVTYLDGHVATEYFALVHPQYPQVLWARRENARPSYGRWARCEEPTDLTGFASVSASALSPKQEAWWRRSAKSFGLDPEAEVDRKSFVALPVLCDLGLKLC